MTRYAHITGWGMAVPDRVLTNEDLAQMADTDDEWIVSRTGIRERRIAQSDETTATLAAAAARQAIEPTDIDAHEVDLIIVATSTPEHLFPSTASLVQDMLGAANAGAFDLSAACTGFIFALNMAAQAIRTGAIDNAVVIGSETMSRVIDWEDRTTCILFGDGAGAFVLQGRERPGGILNSIMRSDGSGGDLLSIPAGGSRLPTTHETVDEKLHLLQMNGREVFRFATRVMASATKEVVAEAGMEIEDIDLVIPHQANQRIIETAARGLKLSMDKFYVNLSKYGNTSTASIPIAFYEAFEDNRIHDGDNMVFVAFGAGLTWGALVVTWVEPEIVVTTGKQRRRKIISSLARIRSILRRLRRKIEGIMFGTTSRGEPEI